MSMHPTLRYTDVDAAVEFLTGTLGLQAAHVYRGDDGTIGHAELAWDDDILMLGPRQDGDPWDTGRAVLYLTIDDVDGHHDRVVAAGGNIVMGLTEQDYGSREFAVADAEGNRWSFGTYRPSLP